MTNKAMIEHYYERNNVSKRFGTPFAEYRNNYNSILQDYCNNTVIQSKGWKFCVDGACDAFLREAQHLQNTYVGYGVRNLQKFWELNRRHTNFYVLGFVDTGKAVVVLDYDLDTPFLIDATVAQDIYGFATIMMRLQVSFPVVENQEYCDILCASNFYDEPINHKAFFTEIYQHYYDNILSLANEADYAVQTCESLLEALDEEIESQREEIIETLEELATSHWAEYRSHNGTPDGILQISSMIVDAYFGRRGDYATRMRNACEVLLRAFRVFALDSTGRSDSHFIPEVALFVINGETYRYFVDPFATSYYDATMGNVDTVRVKKHLGALYDSLKCKVDIDTPEPYAPFFEKDDDIFIDTNIIVYKSQKNTSLMDGLVQAVTHNSNQRVVLINMNRCMCIGTCAEIHNECPSRSRLLKWLFGKFDDFHKRNPDLTRVLMNTPIGYNSDNPDIKNLHVNLCHSIRYLCLMQAMGRDLTREEFVEHGWRYYLAFSYCTSFQATVRNAVEIALRDGGVCNMSVTSNFNTIVDMVFMLDKQSESGEVPVVFRPLHSASRYDKMDVGLWGVVNNNRKLVWKTQKNRTFISPTVHFKFELKHIGKEEREILDLSDIIVVVSHILNTCTETDKLSDIVPFHKLTGRGFMSLCRLIAWAMLALDYSAYTMMHNCSYLGSNREAMTKAFLDELVLTEEAKERAAV